MSRLSRYLFGLFGAQAGALFGLAAVLIFLVQCLRIADATAVRGQGLGVIMLQALLAMPSMAVSFLFVCVAIGMARGLRGLSETRELHIIHAGGRLGGLVGAMVAFALAGALFALALTHAVEPLTQRAGAIIQARIAADIVGRSLVPQRFAEVADGVTITVGERGPNGEITGFFADDRRDPETRRTYMADSALIASDGESYVLQLTDGAIQFRNADGQFSEISFGRYDIDMTRLTGAVDDTRTRRQTTSWTLVAEALSGDGLTPAVARQLVERSVEGLRVLAMCAVVAAIAAFPMGRRQRGWLPLELVVFAIAFAERGITSLLPTRGVLSAANGSIAMLAIAVIVLVFRLRLLSPVWAGRRA